MAFQTFTADPGFPPDRGRTRATIAGFVVDYDPPTAPTAAQVTAQSAPTAAQIDQALVAIAVALADDPSPACKLIRAALLTMMDELNVLRQRDRDRSTDMAAATTLADLKTRWAARSGLADRTAQQIKPALRSRVATPDAD